METIINVQYTAIVFSVVTFLLIWIAPYGSKLLDCLGWSFWVSVMVLIPATLIRIWG